MSTIRIAMWSGPRNISTAMMRSWGNRPDTFVCDEPLYAHYLAHTGLPHPGAADVIAAGETDWQKVATWLTGDVPEGKQIFFQKHMAHHLLPHMDRQWIGRLTNSFLIRHPAEMLTSYVKVVAEPQVLDTAYPQQAEIFDYVCEATGQIPPVIDSRDFLANPEAMLRRWCAEVGVDFTPAMLQWSAGPRATDGVWARHWYSEVERSTTFRPYQPKAEPLAERLRPLYEQCLPYYERLYAHRLTPS
jgi:hypothetical protein